MNRLWMNVLAAGIIIEGGLVAALPVEAANDEITVISREEGSGTRGAFIELFGIESKNAAGKKIDNTIDSADITNSTSVMITSVADNARAIGYISLGSLSNKVKALRIDGAEATVEAIKQNTYRIARPFNIAVREKSSPAVQDFITFILSCEGQKIVESRGLISINNSASAYAGKRVSGRVVVSGSSSITPVMEKLKEAYTNFNPDVAVEIQQSDSTTGMLSTISGIADIGMASRALKSSELEKGLKPVVMAMDGIAVIVSTKNPADELSSAQVRDIYTGKATNWSEICR